MFVKPTNRSNKKGTSDKTRVWLVYSLLVKTVLGISYNVVNLMWLYNNIMETLRKVWLFIFSV